MSVETQDKTVTTRLEKEILPQNSEIKQAAMRKPRYHYAFW